MRCRGVIWFKPTSFDLTMLRSLRGKAFHGRTAETFCGAGESDPARAVERQTAHWNQLAIARGQLWEGQAQGEAGVGATISTGMIGLWK